MRILNLQNTLINLLFNQMSGCVISLYSAYPVLAPLEQQFSMSYKVGVSNAGQQKFIAG